MTTLGQLIAQGEAQFIQAGIQFGQGTLNAWDEARWLALAALELPVDSPADVESRALRPEQVLHVQSVFDRRVHSRLPAAYLTGTAWLKGFAFRVDSRVIIPRSFLAELILGRFAPWVELNRPVARILDLCTGSGCLAIIAAHAFSDAQLVASDISDDALQVAKLNVADYGLEPRITLLQSDLFSGLSPARATNSSATHDDAGQKEAIAAPFDLIVCNPPYVPQRKRKGLPPEFAHEPDLALFAADEGMALVRRILREAPAFLAPGGVLAIEIGREAKAARALLRSEFSALRPIWIKTAEQRDNVFLIQSPSEKT